jgi:hypothetical protein
MTKLNEEDLEDIGKNIMFPPLELANVNFNFRDSKTWTSEENSAGN